MDETNQVSEEKMKEIDDLLQFAASYLKLPEETEMSVTFMDNAAIQVINRDYRGKMHRQTSSVLLWKKKAKTKSQ